MAGYEPLIKVTPVWHKRVTQADVSAVTHTPIDTHIAERRPVFVIALVQTSGSAVWEEEGETQHLPAMEAA